ncbi:MAG TPA: carbohydrate ABC transporter permease, partial [Clostridia bacterium]|nr:carbohydrate ABC transporter permease [Clostridia bacterium]
FYSIIFITDRSKWPMQTVLRQILMSNEFSMMLYDDGSQNLPSEMLKDAMIVLTAMPILCVYPFLQRYFVKGVMIGSVKG